MPLLMVFIDGLGLGEEDREKNPLVTAEMPFFRALLSGRPLTAATIGERIFAPSLHLPDYPALDGFALSVQPTDCSLETPGLPQSATGQTAIFTGVNAAKVAGRHVNGFPTIALREILQENNIFKAINQTGRRAVFANTFTKEYFDIVEQGKWKHSVTTTAALAGGSPIMYPPDLLRGESVYQDITHETLRERGYDVPIYTPEKAAMGLLTQASRNDFTLFEYFQTDHCGHDRNFARALVLLNHLDRFLATVAIHLRKHNLDLLVVSDHGNIEDLELKTHTMNLVPTMALGPGAEKFRGIRTLLDIYPAVLGFLGIT